MKKSNKIFKSIVILFLIFLYAPALLLPIFSFNNSKVIAFPLSGFSTIWFEELFYENTKKSFTSHDNIMDLNKALSKLSSKCRELLLLWGEGYSEKELSVKYGKTASTIGVQTHRCLKKLIPLFKGDELKVN